MTQLPESPSTGADAAGLTPTPPGVGPSLFAQPDAGVAAPEFEAVFANGPFTWSCTVSAPSEELAAVYAKLAAQEAFTPRGLAEYTDFAGMDTGMERVSLRRLS